MCEKFSVQFVSTNLRRYSDNIYTGVFVNRKTAILYTDLEAIYNTRIFIFVIFMTTQWMFCCAFDVVIDRD